jgi:hypothetical protein
MIVDCHCHAGKGDIMTAPWNTVAQIEPYLRRATAAGIVQTIVFAPTADDRTCGRSTRPASAGNIFAVTRTSCRSGGNLNAPRAEARWTQPRWPRSPGAGGCDFASTAATSSPSSVLWATHALPSVIALTRLPADLADPNFRASATVPRPCARGRWRRTPRRTSRRHASRTYGRGRCRTARGTPAVRPVVRPSAPTRTAMPTASTSSCRPRFGQRRICLRGRTARRIARAACARIGHASNIQARIAKPW